MLCQLIVDRVVTISSLIAALACGLFLFINMQVELQAMACGIRVGSLPFSLSSVGMGVWQKDRRWKVSSVHAGYVGAESPADCHGTASQHSFRRRRRSLREQLL